MIKLSIVLAIIVPFLLLQVPAEPVARDDGAGPFANYGQAILAGIVIVMNILSTWYASYMTDRREARKDQLALQQREMDEKKVAQQREWDLEDRRYAREALESRLTTRDTVLVKKVDENTEISKAAMEKVDETNIKIASLVKPYNSVINAENIRRECYEKIKNCMQKGISDYYTKHPELAGDERSKRAVVESLEGLRCVFLVLDDYQVLSKVEEVDNNQSPKGK